MSKGFVPRKLKKRPKSIANKHIKCPICEEFHLEELKSCLKNLKNRLNDERDQVAYLMARLSKYENSGK